MKKINGYEVIQLFEEFSPKKYALDGDPIGLQIGTLNKPVEHVLIALDVSEEVVLEAIEKNVDLIIAHHPLIFRPLKKITTDQFAGRIVEMLIKHDIAVYAAHTNLDVANGGVNDMLANALQLNNVSVLVPTYEEKLKKLVVYVPEANAKDILQALGEAGAGAIGEYSHCSFTTNGVGRFLPGENTNPHIGKAGKLEEVSEVKIETIYPDHLERKVVAAILKAHPYEEPAYDLYSLDMKGEELGLGRIGELEQEMTLEAFALFAKEALDSGGVRVIGNLQDKVKKVAVLGGDGNKYYGHAKFKGADVYVTGDIYYHTAHDALNAGLNMVDPGHHVEKIMKQGVSAILQTKCGEKGYDVTISPSAPNTDPFIYL
ncbi:Nif3-like dinuclear metal center hexameric protein [Bacillus sp. FJAT-50079]|uniref:Nif3-like dinuclear metal center hexameric protein n=1 Tax=Bacillus sp. FJAT-50079 TaxID=2833577 RepID=UPI001BC97BD5|nr:Nif3-like dinuclear metal center hexameric protein [Bacillus sp. FJAT-50079]MBS4209089.1 Nif3-like dinuclear metal center hexameric protein [Bacillus sp. FJAT-50079]